MLISWFCPSGLWCIYDISSKAGQGTVSQGSLQNFTTVAGSMAGPSDDGLSGLGRTVAEPAEREEGRRRLPAHLPTLDETAQKATLEDLK